MAAGVASGEHAGVWHGTVGEADKTECDAGEAALAGRVAAVRNGA